MAKKEHADEASGVDQPVDQPAKEAVKYEGDPFAPSEELLRQFAGVLDGGGQTPAVMSWHAEFKRRTAGRW
jgi:hypothetical protein